MEDIIAKLPLWTGPISISPLSGGLTNKNYLVTDGGRKAVVRLGEDIPVHNVVRSNELAASRAAHAAGLSPEVLYAEPGVLVLDYIDGRTLISEDIRDPAMRARIVGLVKTCHEQIPKYLMGPAMIFWVFHAVRNYAQTLRDGQSAYVARIPDFLKAAEGLEAAAGPFEIVFGHNDLLAANFMDDGDRLWLIDWDYAGFNTPLFDLGGLASNNGFDEGQERELLSQYFARDIPGDDWRRYQAMKCASLLREVVWSMVSEIHSDIDFDYQRYTQENLGAFEKCFDDFKKL